MLQLESCINGSEMPVYAFLSSVSCGSPRFQESPKRRQIRDSVVGNTLATKSGLLNLRNIKPSPVFWCIMNLQTLGKRPGMLRWEGGIQGCNAMSVEVIHYKNNLLSRRILFYQQPIYLLCPILSSPSFLSVSISPSGQRFRKKENTCCAVADILVILILNAILFGAESFAKVGKN